MRLHFASIGVWASVLFTSMQLHAQVNELTLEYMSYWGGTGIEDVTAIDFDSSGYMYISGTTTSPDIPVTAGAYDITYNGDKDIYVCKLDPSGKQIIYCTYIGSPNYDAIMDFKVNSAGEVVVFAYNGGGGFPTTPGAFDETYNGGLDDYAVLKLSADGSSLVYSTYFGGDKNEHEGRMALDSNDNAYIFGITASQNIPTTSGAYQTAYGGGFRDAVLAKFSNTGSLTYCTYLGGSAFDYGRAITINESGEVYLAGTTGSSNFPTTPNAYDQSISSSEDVFIAKISASGSDLLYSTFIKESFQQFSGLMLGKDGDVYAAGYTRSGNSEITPNAYDTSYNGGAFDGVVMKLDSTLSTLQFATYIGGSGDDLIYGLDLDENDNILIVGYTTSADYPITSAALDSTLDGATDVVLSILDSSGAMLSYSTYLGSSSNDYAYYSVDYRQGAIYIAGGTDGSDLPVTTDALDPTYNGGALDAFVAKLVSNQPAKYVLFQSTRDGNSEIYRMDEDGSNLVNLTNHPSADSGPSASPDGSRILFSSDRSGNSEVWSMDFYGNDLVQITNTSEVDGLGEYSPDGSKIVFERIVSPGNPEIFVMDADGSNEVRLTNNSALDSEPRWSPDGTKILFARVVSSLWQVFVMDANGSNQTQLTFTNRNWYHAWSPDGKHILYDRVYSGGIYIADIDPTYTTLSNEMLITDANNKGVPSWAPANRILYQHLTNSIYVMDADGSNVTLLTTSSGTNEYARWLCAAFAEVSLPDTTIAYNQAISVPVSISRVGSDIVSAELFVTFDSAILTYNSVVTTGALAAGWTIESNIASGVGGIDTLKIAAATDNNAITVDGALLYLDFQTADIRQPTASALDIVHALLNDGSPETLAIDGSVTIVGNDAAGSTDVTTIIPRQTITVTIIDADEDLDGVASTDQVSVAVSNGAQTETLTLNETTTPGEFTGSISTVFALASTAAASSGDNTVQAKAGDQIAFSFVDQLLSDGSGPANLNLLVNVIGGTDGSLRTTVVAQPGDTVRVRVTDADLSDSVPVLVENIRTGESEEILLREFTPGGEVFFGRFFVAKNAPVSGDSTIEAARCDTLIITYADTLTALGGTASITYKSHVVDPFGDGDGNGQTQAFDAALVLKHVLFKDLALWDSLSVNVDAQAPFSPITPFDASLILQKRVGLIGRFPIQEPTSDNQPQPETGLQPGPKLVPQQIQLALHSEDGYLSVWAEDRAAIVAGDLLLEGAIGKVEMGEELAGFLSASRSTEQGLRVVFAGAEAVSGPGELLRIYGVGPEGARLIRAAFNDGEWVGSADAVRQSARPTVLALHANMPNPFNPETAIRFELPSDSAVELVVYDALGQRVRTLVEQALPAGVHQAVWDGRNQSGQSVSTGIYFYQLRAGDVQLIRRMLLLK